MLIGAPRRARSARVFSSLIKLRRQRFWIEGSQQGIQIVADLGQAALLQAFRHLRQRACAAAKARQRAMHQAAQLGDISFQRTPQATRVRHKLQ